MKIKAIVDEGFQDYKLPYMYIAMPHCNFKCCTEANIPIETCQNSEISKQDTIDISIKDIIKRYINNPITRAVVIAGLEPFDNAIEVLDLVYQFRKKSDDDIVIYTGYNRIEVECWRESLEIYNNIIIKYGRYIPNKPNRFDDVLGVALVSDNQYAERIS